MELDRDEFKKTLENGINIHTEPLDEKEKSYIRERGELIFDLIEELNEKELLRKHSVEEIKQIHDSYHLLMRNVDEIKNLYFTIIKIAENNSDLAATHVNLIDTKKNTYIISMNQALLITGLAYNSLCEVIKTFLGTIINFNITGLGNLQKKLSDEKIENMKFFADLDADVRNAFTHLDFKVQDEKINLYKKREFLKSISLEYLFMLIIKADRSSYAVMHVCEYILKKY